MSDRDDATREASLDESPNRRTFLRTVGATAGSAAILGSAGSVTAASSGPFAPMKREELSGDALDEAVETALDDERTQAVLDELPGGANRLDADDAEAYRVVNTSDDSAPITQVLVPVSGRDSRLGYARSDGETAVGLELGEGNYLQSIDRPGQADTAVEHKHVADGEEKAKILGRVKREHDLDHYDENEATVTVVEEADTAYAVVPASEASSKADESSRLVATVDLDEDEVTVQGATSDCIISCLATSTKFWGICWSCCCQWCWNGLGCTACAGCVGITLSKCGLQCAGTVI